MKQECGFGRFLALRTFNDPLNGYLVNDTCVFGAEVYVCKENNRGKGESLLMMKDAISHKHTWKIQALSTIKEDFQESLPFNAGDHKWYAISHSTLLKKVMNHVIKNAIFLCLMMMQENKVLSEGKRKWNRESYIFISCFSRSSQPSK